MYVVPAVGPDKTPRRGTVIGTRPAVGVDEPEEVVCASCQYQQSHAGQRISIAQPVTIRVSSPIEGIIHGYSPAKFSDKPTVGFQHQMRFDR